MCMSKETVFEKQTVENLWINIKSKSNKDPTYKTCLSWKISLRQSENSLRSYCYIVCGRVAGISASNKTTLRKKSHSPLLQ